MKLSKLSYVVGALFFLAACAETGAMKDGAADGSGKAMEDKKMAATGSAPRQRPPTGFSIAEGSQQDFVINVGDRVYYDFDRSSLKPAARTTLEKQSVWLKKFPAVQVAIEGHADERGTREYNLALGERRANSAKDFLVALGINPSRLRVVSFGKERPVALGHDDASWSQNRRAVTVPTSGLPGS